MMVLEGIFFRDAWDIIGSDIIDAILDVLMGRKLLKELNATMVILIPKSKCLLMLVISDPFLVVIPSTNASLRLSAKG